MWCKMVISNDVSIASGMLVPEPNYGDLPEINIPITNPDLERWLLLMGQLGNVDDENSKLIYGLYYKFMSKELLKALTSCSYSKGWRNSPSKWKWRYCFR